MSPVEPPARHSLSCRGDAGSAVVEFVLVTVLLLPLFMGLVQLGYVLYVRNTLVAASAEGARYGANADRDPAAGAAVTRRIIQQSLADSFARHVSAGRDTVGGVPTVYVEVSTRLPLVGPFAATRRTLVVRGHALAERP